MYFKDGLNNILVYKTCGFSNNQRIIPNHWQCHLAKALKLETIGACHPRRFCDFNSFEIFIFGFITLILNHK